MPGSIILESPENAAHWQTAFAEKAEALGLKPVKLPFASICVDGEPCGTPYQPPEPFPTALEEPEIRLQRMGTMVREFGNIEFIDADGGYYLARDVPANVEALEAAGFSKGQHGAHFVSVYPQGELKTAFEALKHTPRDANEQLRWAVESKDLVQFELALAQGASISQTKTIQGEPIIFAAIPVLHNRDDVLATSCTMIKRMLPESPLVMNNGDTLLHDALSNGHKPSIIPFLLQEGFDPLARNAQGKPAFLSLSHYKESAREELQLISDVIQKDKGLTDPEKRLLQIQCQMIDAAIVQDREEKEAKKEFEFISEKIFKKHISEEDRQTIEKYCQHIATVLPDTPASAPIKEVLSQIVQLAGNAELEGWQRRNEISPPWLAVKDNLPLVTNASQVMKNLESAWGQAHEFSEITSLTATQQACLFLDPLANPVAAPKLMEVLSHYDMHKLRGVNDMVREFTSHVVLPLCIAEYAQQTGNTITDDFLRQFDGKENELVANLISVVKAQLLKSRSIDKIIGLNEAWHDPRVIFPDPLKPIKSTGKWFGLTEKKEIPVQGLPGISIHVLNDDKELIEESGLMKHCVGHGGYTPRCLAGELHIFSIRKQGQEIPLSTIDAAWDGKTLRVTNDGYNNTFVPEDARTAAAWLKEQIESGAIATRPLNELGETDESGKQHSRPPLLRIIGNEITTENINASYHEFCHNNKRRGREYNPETDTFDIISKSTYLIQGQFQTVERDTVTNEPLLTRDGRQRNISVAYRDAKAEQWFEASGLKEKAMAVTFQPAIDKLLEARKAEEVAGASAATSIPEAAQPAADEPSSAAAHTKWQHLVAGIGAKVENALANAPILSPGIAEANRIFELRKQASKDRSGGRC